MFLKITLGLIFLQTAVIQIFTRGQVLNDAVESQLINIREGQRLHSDEIHEVYEKMDGLETKLLEKIKDLLCAGCKGNTTTTTTQKPNTEPRSCQEWLQETGRSGTYLIKPSATSNLTFKAYCLIKKDRLGVEEEEATFWTVILRRKDGSVDFNRNWKDYQRGFGNIDGEFILGLDYIHELTRSAQQELWVALESRDGVLAYAKYDNFVLGNSTESYMLKSLGHFSGNVYNALKTHLGWKWSTKDVDNDGYGGNCAESFGGGWWYTHCIFCVLTGHYNYPKEKGKCINWNGFGRNPCDIKYALMAIRDFKQKAS